MVHILRVEADRQGMPKGGRPPRETRLLSNMKEIEGPWYSQPWWLKQPLHWWARFCAMWTFAMAVADWLLVVGPRARAWEIGGPSSPSTHIDILWSSCIGMQEARIGAYVELVVESKER